MKIDYIKCHGSGNEFVMMDATKGDWRGIDLSALSRFVCNRESAIGSDGVLLLCRKSGMFGMRMFNPDGSEAEMCGNGIRCVARLAQEQVKGREFDMWSGKKTYHISHTKDIYEGVTTYGVRLEAKVVGEPNRLIPALHSELRWTAVDVGNPHIVALVEKIDYALLRELGERVTTLKEEFPQGVNLSLITKSGRRAIFVATYERGAGITPSCGTAMTASATAMAFNGECDYEQIIEVRNRGGMVQCVCYREGEKLHTQLIGNATYISRGKIEIGKSRFSLRAVKRYDKEEASYNKFVARGRK